MTRRHDVDTLERWRDENVVWRLKVLKWLDPGA